MRQAQSLTRSEVVEELWEDEEMHDVRERARLHR